MNDFLSGAAFVLWSIAGLLFLRFWRKTADRFFLFFSIAFWLMALHRVVLLVLRDGTEEYVSESYLVRLLAYVLILVAIWEKNRAPPRKGPRQAS